MRVVNKASYAIAKYVAMGGLGAGALLLFGPVIAPTVGHWLLSIGVISGVTAERMAWGPIAYFGTLIPGSIAVLVGLLSLTIAIVLRVRAHEGPIAKSEGRE
jgi:hypothetical protein